MHGDDLESADRARRFTPSPDTRAASTPWQFSPDGHQVLTGAADHTMILWDITTGAKSNTFVEVTENIIALAPDADDPQLFNGINASGVQSRRPAGADGRSRGTIWQFSGTHGLAERYTRSPDIQVTSVQSLSALAGR